MRVLGPVALVVVLSRLPDREGFLRRLLGTRLWPLLGAVALTFANLQLKVLRWQSLVRPLGARPSLGRSWSVYLASSYAGLLTPGRVGDALRASYLHRDTGLMQAAGLAAVVVDRLCDLWVLGFFSSLALVHWAPLLETGLGSPLGLVGWGSLGVVLAVPLGLGALAWSTTPRSPERGSPGDEDGSGSSPSQATPAGPRRGRDLLVRLLAKLRPGAGREALQTFHFALRAQLGVALRAGLPLTLAATSLNYVQGWLLAQSLGVPLSLLDAAGLLAVVSLLGLLPVSISGLGVREGFLLLAFPALGYEASQGLSFGLLVFGVLYLAILLPAFVAFQLDPPPLASPPKG